MGNIPAIVELIGKTIKEKGGDPSRFATWPVPINMVMINGSFAYAQKYIAGETNGKNDAEVLKACLAEAAGTEITVSLYESADGQVLDNTYMMLCDFIDFSVAE